MSRWYCAGSSRTFSRRFFPARFSRMSGDDASLSVTPSSSSMLTTSHPRMTRIPSFSRKSTRSMSLTEIGTSFRSSCPKEYSCSSRFRATTWTRKRMECSRTLSQPSLLSPFNPRTLNTTSPATSRGTVSPTPARRTAVREKLVKGTAMRERPVKTVAPARSRRARIFSTAAARSSRTA